jgi:hypothetical protein
MVLGEDKITNSFHPNYANRGGGEMV